MARKSRKAARRQTFQQNRKRKSSLRLNLYHGSSAKSIRSIRATGFRARNMPTLSTNKRIAKLYMYHSRLNEFPTHVPKNMNKYITRVSLTPHGVKKYAEYSELVGGSLAYGIHRRIPSRFIDKRRRGK